MMSAITACLLLVLALATQALASDVIDSKAAFAAVNAGEMTLMDVRSPAEWRETGLPKGAKAITIHGPDGMAGFVASATKAVNGKKDQPIALICATGGRSGYVVRELGRHDLHFLHIGEGVHGSAAGPGWLARKLPVRGPGMPVVTN